MQIKYVEIENILSIQQIKLQFGNAGLVLLDGWNYDDDTANAAGKTAIFNSIAYALYGKFPRKISASDILRSGTKSGFSKVGVEVNGSLYEVYRARPNCIKYYVDGLEKDITQEEFENFIRISYSQYLISMYSAQTEGIKLISLNDSGKKDFFLQLMNLDSFEECREAVNAELSALYNSETKYNQAISTFKAKIDTYRESVVKYTPRVFTNPDEIRIKLEQFLELEYPDTSKFDTLEQKLNEEYMRLHTLEVEEKQKHKQFEALNKKLEAIRNTNHSKIVCPHCDKSFTAGGDHVKMQEVSLVDEIRDLERDLFDPAEYEMQKSNVRVTIEKCKVKRTSSMQDYWKNKEELNDLNRSLQYSERCRKEEVDILFRNQELETKVSKYLVLATEEEAKLDVVKKEIELKESILAIFSPTGAPAYVLDATVDVFNDKVMQYASLIWPNASYTLQSFKENKSGEIKAKFSEKLVINGKERSIGALSGGEHRCLSLAVDFAIVDVLETMFGMSINPIMLDEPFNDLDASNRERVLELLDKISSSRQIWIIDHATEVKAMFSNIVRVEKRSGISAVV